MASIKEEAPSQVTLMTTELNSLANNAGVISVEYDNSVGLYLYGLFELNVTFGSNPTANNTVDLYLMSAPDGTTYDDYTAGASGYAPWTSFVGGFPLQAKTTVHHIQLGKGLTLINLPPCKMKAFVINKSGVAFPASGSTLKMVPYRYQTV